MESKFEILSYQNCNDLKKAINTSSVLIGACTLLLGLYLAFFVSVSDPTSNLNMLRLAAGWVLAGFGLVTLVSTLADGCTTRQAAPWANARLISAWSNYRHCAVC